MDKMKQTQSQKKLGLILGGGGARGLSHIGILKVLDDEKIDISSISGCSMGGLVGALYALGYSINELIEISWLRSSDRHKETASLRTRTFAGASMMTKLRDEDDRVRCCILRARIRRPLERPRGVEPAM